MVMYKRSLDAPSSTIGSASYRIALESDLERAKEQQNEVEIERLKAALDAIKDKSEEKSEALRKEAEKWTLINHRNLQLNATEGAKAELAERRSQIKEAGTGANPFKRIKAPVKLFHNTDVIDASLMPAIDTGTKPKTPAETIDSARPLSAISLETLQTVLGPSTDDAQIMDTRRAFDSAIAENVNLDDIEL